MDKFDLMKICFCAYRTLSKEYKKATYIMGENIYNSDKELISRLHIAFLKLKKKKKYPQVFVFFWGGAENGDLVSNGYSVSILLKMKNFGDRGWRWLHKTVFNTTELYT